MQKISSTGLFWKKTGGIFLNTEASIGHRRPEQDGGLIDSKSWAVVGHPPIIFRQVRVSRFHLAPFPFALFLSIVFFLSLSSPRRLRTGRWPRDFFTLFLWLPSRWITTLILVQDHSGNYCRRRRWRGGLWQPAAMQVLQWTFAVLQQSPGAQRDPHRNQRSRLEASPISFLVAPRLRILPFSISWLGYRLGINLETGLKKWAAPRPATTRSLTAQRFSWLGLGVLARVLLSIGSPGCLKTTNGHLKGRKFHVKTS